VSKAPQVVTSDDQSSPNYYTKYFNDKAELDKAKSLVDLKQEFIDVKEIEEMKDPDELEQMFTYDKPNDTVYNEYKQIYQKYQKLGGDDAKEANKKAAAEELKKLEAYLYYTETSENIKDPTKTGLISILDYLKNYKNDGKNKYVMMCLTHPRLKDAYCEGVCKGLEFAQEVAASASTDAGTWICNQALFASGVDTEKYEEDDTANVIEQKTPTVHVGVGGYKHRKVYSQKRHQRTKGKNSNQKKYSQKRRRVV
jgi:hypothetical protein